MPFNSQRGTQHLVVPEAALSLSSPSSGIRPQDLMNRILGHEISVTSMHQVRLGGNLFEKILKLDECNVSCNNTCGTKPSRPSPLALSLASASEALPPPPSPSLSRSPRLSYHGRHAMAAIFSAADDARPTWTATTRSGCCRATTGRQRRATSTSMVRAIAKLPCCHMSMNVRSPPWCWVAECVMFFHDVHA